MERAIVHRPMLVLAACLAAALAWRVNPWALVLALPFLGFRQTWPMAASGLVLGFFLAPDRAPLLLERRSLEGETTVASVPRVRPQRIEFEAEIESRRYAARLPGLPHVAFGDRLRIRGVLRPLHDGVDEYARLQGIEGRLDLKEWTVVERGSWAARTADGWRRSFAAFTGRWLTDDLAALTQALCLNLDGTLDDATRNRLRATGTVHIVSASGLHVLILAGALMVGLALLPIPHWAQLALLALLLAFYALATGLNAPVVRSALMAVVGMSAYLLRRDRDALSALAVAAVVYLLWRPRGVFDIGFQLSFVTVAGLALYIPVDHEPPASLWQMALRGVADVARVSWIAFAASAPLVAYHFGTLSLVALPANLLVALPVTGMVVFGLLAHSAWLLWPALGVGLLSVVAGMGGWIVGVLEWLGDLPWAQVAVPAFPAWVIVVVYGALVATWRERHVLP